MGWSPPSAAPSNAEISVPVAAAAGEPDATAVDVQLTATRQWYLDPPVSDQGARKAGQEIVGRSPRREGQAGHARNEAVASPIQCRCGGHVRSLITRENQCLPQSRQAASAVRRYGVGRSR